MLYYPKDVIEKLAMLESQPRDPENFEGFARQVLNIDPDNGLARIMLAATAEEAGDLVEAERLAWEGLDRIPNECQSYLTLSRMLAWNKQETLARRMFHLAIWKAVLAEEVDSGLAELVEGSFGIHKDLDSLETYALLAVAGDEHAKKQPDSREIEQRILPYRLLNDLHKQADEDVRSATVKEIVKEGERCAPLFYYSLRQFTHQWGALDQPFPMLLIAMLGEISGPEMAGELLELADDEYKSVAMHSAWAIWRLGQRHPKETLRALREAAPAASTLLRGRLAEQLTYLPPVEGVTEALIFLLDDFASREMDDDAEILLALVANGLIERQEDDRAREVLKAKTPLLSRKGRTWMKGIFQGDGTFAPILAEEGVTGYDIHDLCLGRVYMDDRDEDDDEYDDEDEFNDEDDDIFDEPLPLLRPKLGRNEPCWCGSGKKYKKCHLNADEVPLEPPPGRPN